jgi:hypothetical protein
MTKPPDGYDCNVIGFNNVPSTASDKMPVPTNKTTTTLADAVTQTSNTTRIPFGGPNVPKGN